MSYVNSLGFVDSIRRNLKTNSRPSFFFQLRDAAPTGAGAVPAQSLSALEEERGRAIIRTKLQARSEIHLGSIPILCAISEQGL